MGKWVQKAVIGRKNVQNGNTHFILLKICAWLSEKKIAKTRLGGSLQVSVILGLYNFLHKAHFGSALLYPKSFCGV